MGSHSGDDITLFSSRFSPFVQRVRIALREKDIPYTKVDVDYAAKPKELLDANPFHATVPTLIHAGTPVLESLIILEYLEETFPDKSPLMPKDPAARAKARFYADYIYRNFPSVSKVASTQPGTPEREAALSHMPGFLKSLNDIMTEFSAEGPYFTGATFSYLDVVLAPLTAYRLLVTEKLGVKLPAPAEIPRFAKWVTTVKAHEAAKAEVPTPEEGRDHFYPKIVQRSEALAATGK